MPDSDESLMLAYAAGDTNAFETLYRRHRGAVYRYLLRQGIRQQQADELFQDIWLRVINARSSYTVRARFTTWLYRIAHNRVVDEFRRTPRLSVIAADPGDTDLPLQAVGNGPEPPELLETQRLGTLLKRLIAELPDEQRDSFLLREEAGLSVDQIADVTGAGREAVKSRLRYAVAKLRAGLEAAL